MPIKAEMRWFYPIDWPQLSRHVRFERAGGVCRGCGRPHGAIVRCLPDGRWHEEFADTSDLPLRHLEKQVDPVNFDRLFTDLSRERVFQCVARLVHFRTTSNALAVNDTEFIDVDFNDNKPGARLASWPGGS